LALEALLPARRWRRRAAVGATAVAAAAGLVLNWPAMDLSGDREALDYARRALEDAAPHATLLTDDDRHTFALWYAQRALGTRSDVAIHDLRFDDATRGP